MANLLTPVETCRDAMLASMQSIAKLNNKVLFSANEDSFLDNIKGVKSFPAGFVLYEGMRATPEQGSLKIGGMAEMVFSLVVVSRDTAILSTDQAKDEAIKILDALRHGLLGVTSPTGHKWKFLVEAAASERDGALFWVQRWSTPISLVGRPAYPT